MNNIKQLFEGLTGPEKIQHIGNVIIGALLLAFFLLLCIVGITGCEAPRVEPVSVDTLIYEDITTGEDVIFQAACLDSVSEYIVKVPGYFIESPTYGFIYLSTTGVSSDTFLINGELIGDAYEALYSRLSNSPMVLNPDGPCSATTILNDTLSISGLIGCDTIYSSSFKILVERENDIPVGLAVQLYPN